MTGKVQWRNKLHYVVLTVLLALTMVLTFICFSTVCHAETQAKVKVKSAFIRQEASTNSEKIGSAVNGDILSVVSQVQDSTGHTWYQVFVDANTKGYVRDDTVDISGSTPPAQNPTTAPGAPEVNDIPAVTNGMEAVNPISATVSKGDSVRVRADAVESSSNIITKVSKGTALTVMGTKTSADGNVWYYVNFAKDGKEISGYIRSDYATVSGDLTPVETQQDVPEENTETEEPDPLPEPEVIKDYDTQLEGGEWYIIDNVNQKRQSIQGLFDAVTQNAAAYEKEAKKAKTEKVIIIILVLLLIAAAGAAGYLFMKMRDMADQEYFSRVEKDTLTKRRATAGQSGTHKIMHSVGEDKPQIRRPAGAGQSQRPAGAGQPQRPAGAGQPQRPAGAGQPQRPAGAGQPQRPAGAGQPQRPAGAGQPQRPAGAGQPQRSAGAGQPQRPVEKVHVPKTQISDDDDWFDIPTEPEKKPKKEEWKAKNFMTDDDDEFEFGFFNLENDDDLV